MRVFLCLMLVLILLLPIGCKAEVYLRVVGESNSWRAVKQKHQIRDAILSVCPSDVRLLPAALPKIREAANQIAPCTLSLKNSSPIKNAPVLPMLYVAVGSAKGHNWFGLLYEDSLSLFSIEGTQGEPIFTWPFFNWLFKR